MNFVKNNKKYILYFIAIVIVLFFYLKERKETASILAQNKTIEKENKKIDDKVKCIEACVSYEHNSNSNKPWIKLPYVSEKLNVSSIGMGDLSKRNYLAYECLESCGVNIGGCESDMESIKNHLMENNRKLCSLRYFNSSKPEAFLMRGTADEVIIRLSDRKPVGDLIKKYIKHHEIESVMSTDDFISYCASIGQSITFKNEDFLKNMDSDEKIRNIIREERDRGREKITSSFCEYQLDVASGYLNRDVKKRMLSKKKKLLAN